MSRRNPGLKAREKLPPVVAKAKKAAFDLHRAMMSRARRQVKPHACRWLRIAKLEVIRVTPGSRDSTSRWKAAYSSIPAICTRST